MVYARRRSTYRRKGRRGNRALSTRRIFNNKSAKAQAKQIYALRRSVNRVARMCRPEVKVTRSSTYNDVIGLNNIYPGQTIESVKSYAVNLPALGVADTERIGNIIKALPVKINFSSQYKKIYNSVTTPIASPLINTSGGVRMIVIQTKAAINEFPNIQDILRYTPTSLADSVGILNSPFTDGITARYHILYNRVMYYSENKLIRCKNFKIRPAIKTIRWESGITYPEGTIFVFLCAGGFSFTDVGSGDTPYDYDLVDYAIRFEQPYTDA